MSDLSQDIMQSSASNSNAKPERDTFKEEWKADREFWVKIHRKWDYNYLSVKSIMSYNSVYGEKYLKTYGIQVYVPRSFTTVESLLAKENRRKVQFVTDPLNNKSRLLTKYVQKIDNIEWKRSGTDKEAIEARKNAAIFGNGYILNLYIEDKVIRHMPVTEKEEEAGPQDPEDGVEDTDGTALVQEEPQEAKASVDEAVDEATEGDEVASEGEEKEKITTADGITWTKEEITRYRGVKGVSKNPYYVFVNKDATDKDDMGHVFLYNIMSVTQAQDYVVSMGWMTREDAEKKIVSVQVDYFDKVREIVDWMYTMPYNGYNRGDHQNIEAVGTNLNTDSSRPAGEMTVIIERWGEDTFEARLGEDQVIIKTFNPLPHKKIPVVPFFNYKLPDEFPAMGEPEVIRHQQVEENKIHNFILQWMLGLLAQRFAVDVSMLEDENDLLSEDPFRPIRMKMGLGGIPVSQAIMALPTPEIKQSPFQLMNLVKGILQETTGANDFVTSASEATTDTATESNNLVAATTDRIAERLRNTEESLSEIVNQWHPLYFSMYSEEMDLRLTGKAKFIRYLPYNREEVNENPEMVAAANAKLNAKGRTLVEAYKYAGYEDVVFISDLDGEFESRTRISDPEADEKRTVATFDQLITVVEKVNQLAQQAGSPERIDVHKIGQDMLRNVSFLGDIEDYMTDVRELEAAAQLSAPQPEPQQAMPAPGGMPPVEGAQPQPEAAQAFFPDPTAQVNSTPPQPGAPLTQ